MSTTTALELLEQADLLTRQLRKVDVPTTTAQWESFDVTLHRLLLELIGTDAGHVRTADPSWRALNLAIRSYPTPLRPPVDTQLTPAHAAHYLEVSRSGVRDAIRFGRLRSVKEGGVNLVDSRDIDTRPDIRPADPTDRHPLSRIACHLGALADLVHDARTAGPEILRGNGEIAGAARHVLSLAAVAARHTLAHGEIADAGRPLVVGQYAERVIDTLRDVALRPASLDRLASTHPVAQPITLNDQLEAALHGWGTSARDEITRTIPSVDVLRQIANQGAHLSDVRALLEADPEGETARAARQNAAALAASGRAWGTFTTLTRPSHEFVTASRELFEAISLVGNAAGDPRLDARRAAADLDRGLTVVGHLMTLTRSMPERLIAGGVLRGPAKSLRSTDDRLDERAQGRYARVRPADAAELTSAWRGGCTKLDGPVRANQREVVAQRIL